MDVEKAAETSPAERQATAIESLRAIALFWTFVGVLGLVVWVLILLIGD